MASASSSGGVPLNPDRSRKKNMSVLKLSPKDLSLEMNKISDETVTNLLTHTQEVDIGKQDLTIFMVFEFQGFDPFAIIKKLIALKNHYGLTDEDLKVDIMYMIAANIYMGNLSGKSLIRRGQEGRDIVDELAARYQVRAGTTGTGLPSDVITFPRVAGSFPVLSCNMANRLPTKDMVGQPFKSVPVPKFMRMNVFSTFCPPALNMRTRLFLLKSCAAYSCDQSIVFLKGEMRKQKKSSDESKIDPKTIAADQWTYIWATSEGPVPPLPARRRFHAHINTSGLYKELLPVVENYNVVMDDPTAVPTQKEYEEDISEFISG
jgi:hypothetical protein